MLILETKNDRNFNRSSYLFYEKGSLEGHVFPYGQHLHNKVSFLEQYFCELILIFAKNIFFHVILEIHRSIFIHSPIFLDFFHKEVHKK